MKNLKLISSLLTLFFFASNCKKESSPKPDPGSSVKIIKENLILNPSGYSPLAARLDIELDEAVRIDMKIEGKNGVASDLVYEGKDISRTHELTLLGLYPASTNGVKLDFWNTEGVMVGTKRYEVETDILLEDLPKIILDVADPGGDKAKLTLVSYFGYAGIPIPPKPFIMDQFGDIRWYLNYKQHPLLKRLFYDVGMGKLQNGNFYFGDGESDTIYEIDPFGLIVNFWNLPGFEHHHTVYEKPNGNFLVTVNKFALETVEDHIIEVDRQSKKIINVWDLRASLDRNRQAMTLNRSDWIHVNAIAYDESDNSIIISGRTQGVVKLSEDNEVIWILGNHKAWSLSGDGTDLTTKLLQPLDAMDNPIVDAEVLLGNKQHPDFDWNWYQHSVKLLPDGNILVFDNGSGRNYSDEEQYSRAVEYQIDPVNKTVSQVWAYGKERGLETYSRIVSSVEYLADENRIIFAPGAIAIGGEDRGKVVEIDYTSGNVLFEATIRPPRSFVTITFHQTRRVGLYE